MKMRYVAARTIAYIFVALNWHIGRIISDIDKEASKPIINTQSAGVNGIYIYLNKCNKGRHNLRKAYCRNGARQR